MDLERGAPDLRPGCVDREHRERRSFCVGYRVGQ